MASFACSCGNLFRAPDDRAEASCPSCGKAVAARARAAVTPPAPVAPAPRPSRRVVVTSAAAPVVKTSDRIAAVLSGGWNRRYLVFLIALLPLVVSVVSGSDDVTARIERTIEQAPADQRPKLRELEMRDEDAFIRALPRQRLDGALLSRNTQAHWGFAIVSAALYFAVLLLVFPPGKTDPKHLVLTGVFTGTIGIFFLLVVQVIAIVSSAFPLGSGGVVVMVFKVIGYSYRAALDPDSHFIPSFLGFTAGVGLCEELCKATPLLFHFRRKATLDWRGACLWGLASGIGFGVSEGITYSADNYNGVGTGNIYLIRFASCVALHAVWAAAAGITLCRRRSEIQGRFELGRMAAAVIRIFGVPMVLHGLYDTLLKKDHDLVAVAVALASFGWLAYQIELQVKDEATPRIMAT